MALRSEINSFFGGSTPALTRIIVINIFIFLFVNLYINITHSRDLVELFELPSDNYLLLRRPWTLFTYMFFHEELGHIFWNMIMFYWMGRIFAEFMGEKRMVYTYVLGGLSGGLLFYLVFGLAFPQHNLLLGASAGIMAVMVAIAGLVPN